MAEEAAAAAAAIAATTRHRVAIIRVALDRHVVVHVRLDVVRDRRVVARRHRIVNVVVARAAARNINLLISKIPQLRITSVFFSDYQSDTPLLFTYRLYKCSIVSRRAPGRKMWRLKVGK